MPMNGCTDAESEEKRMMQSVWPAPAGDRTVAIEDAAGLATPGGRLYSEDELRRLWGDSPEPVVESATPEEDT